MKKNLIMAFCIFAGAAQLSAQSNTVASGGNATGAGGSASYSIGQIDYVTASGGNGTMTEGNQQPYEILITGINDPVVSLGASAWPNPATDYITVSVVKLSPGNTFYTLHDDQGKLIEQQDISTTNTQISMATLANGIYFLEVTDNNSKKTKSFKIIKNK